MVNFQRMADKSRASRHCKHLVGMAIDLHIAPDLHDLAVWADQNGCSKNALEGPAIHGFFSPRHRKPPAFRASRPKREERKVGACPERLPASLANRLKHPESRSAFQRRHSPAA